MSIEVVWFKRDLRTSDHLPLEATSGDLPVLCLFLVEPQRLAQPAATPYTSNGNWTVLTSSGRNWEAGANLDIMYSDALEAIGNSR